MSEKSPEKSKMSDLTWSRDMLHNHVAPKGSAASVGERIRNAALALKWKHSRTATLWYADERASVRPAEIRRLEDVTGVQYGQREVREVSDFIARADALLMGSDPDFYSAFVAALRSVAGAAHRARTGRSGDAE
jgi:hypothetical protein